MRGSATPAPSGGQMDPTEDRFLLKACVRCGGDLALDDGDWLCLQCGRYYYRRATLEANPHWREFLRRLSPGDGAPPPGAKSGITGASPRLARCWTSAALAAS